MGLHTCSLLALELLFICADKLAGKGLLTGPCWHAHAPAGQLPCPICFQLLCRMERQADGQDHPLRQRVWQGGLAGYNNEYM